MKWESIWTGIHSIGILIAGFLFSLLPSQDLVICYFTTGLVVTILAQVVRTFTAHKEFVVNGWLFTWFSINTLAVYVVSLMLAQSGSLNPFLWLISTSVGLVAAGKYFKRCRWRGVKLYLGCLLGLVIIYSFPTGPLHKGGCVSKVTSLSEFQESLNLLSEQTESNYPHVDDYLTLPTFLATDEEQDKRSFDYANELRTKNGVSIIRWDDRAHNLGLDRAKDMVINHYFDHTSPKGACPANMKQSYGFSSETLAENIWGTTGYSRGTNEPIDSWMESRGHRANLLYPSHKSGAVACYDGICVFIGVHNDQYGLGGGGCSTGAEGEAFWDAEPKQSWER